MISRLACFTLLLLGLRIQPLSSQAPAAGLPSDPTALMALAHDRNSLVGPGIHPWHIHGAYRFLGKDGKPEDEGIYEEWWISPSKYKRSFTSKGFTQTDYADGKSLFRDGAQEWPHGSEIFLRTSLIDPLPDASQLKEFVLGMQPQPAGQVTIECVAMTFPIRPGVNLVGDPFTTACFDTHLPVLRLYARGESFRVVYDKLVAFQGHYVAKQLRVSSAGKPEGELDIDTIEGLKDTSDSVVTPPATAKSIDLAALFFAEGGMKHFPEALKKAIPIYPLIAKNQQIQGNVIVRATVGTDGHVSNLRAISGPLVLQQPALDSVAQWIYRPFEIMGEPRQFEMEFKVIFTLG